jgi:hypothetical protein
MDSGNYKILKQKADGEGWGVLQHKVTMFLRSEMP